METRPSQPSALRTAIMGKSGSHSRKDLAPFRLMMSTFAAKRSTGSVRTQEGRATQRESPKRASPITGQTSICGSSSR